MNIIFNVFTLTEENFKDQRWKTQHILTRGIYGQHNIICVKSNTATAGAGLFTAHLQKVF